MEEKITVDTIVNYLRDCVEGKVVIDAHTWIDAAQKLTVLLSDEHDKLFDLQQIVAQKKVNLIEGGASGAESKMRVEALDEYREMSKQRAKIERIEEMVRIAKIQARLKDEEMRGYGVGTSR